MCRPFLITLKYFYQYLTDKIYNNKYFFHQNPGPLSPTIAKLWQNFYIHKNSCNKVANILGNFLNKTERISRGHFVPPPKIEKSYSRIQDGVIE